MEYAVNEFQGGPVLEHSYERLVRKLLAFERSPAVVGVMFFAYQFAYRPVREAAQAAGDDRATDDMCVPSRWAKRMPRKPH